PVVVVEDLVNGDVHLQTRVDGVRVRLLLDHLGRVFPCSTGPIRLTLKREKNINVPSFTYRQPRYPSEAPRKSTWSACHPCRSRERSSAEKGREQSKWSVRAKPTTRIPGTKP